LIKDKFRFVELNIAYIAALVFKRNQAAISILKEVFAMNETDYNARLYEKMKAEQDKYHLPFCT